MNNMIIADISQGNVYPTNYKLYQYDYGRILRIQGVNLPAAVEIDFSLSEKGGESKSRIGTTVDGVTDVPIPDSMLENNDTTEDYYLYAFIYLTDETSGRTVRKITLKVTTRPKPEPFDTPEEAELFRDAIAAVNESAERAESAKTAAETARDTAQETADSIRTDVQNMVDYANAAKNAASESANISAKNAEYTKLDREEVSKNKSDVEQMKSQVENAVKNALLSEQNAKASVTAAQKAQECAEAAKGQAGEYKKAAEDIKADVMKLGQKVEEDKNSVEHTVTEFDITRQNAVKEVKDAEQAAIQNIGTGIDDTLMQPGKAADSKVTGDSIKELQNNLALNVISDEKTKRSLDFLWKLNQGISYQYETDSASAYQKDIPSGAKVASVNKVGGKTVVWGQLIPACSVKGNSNFTVADTFTKIYAGHKYYMSFKYSGTPNETNGNVSAFISKDGVNTISMSTPYGTPEAILTAKYTAIPWIYFYPIDADVVTYDLQVVDITLLEQSLGITIDTVSDYKSLFPKDYYDTCPLTLLSAPVNEVVEQGKNLMNLGSNDFSNTVNGITLSYDAASQSISMKGTNTASAAFLIINRKNENSVDYKIGETYTISHNLPDYVYAQITYINNAGKEKVLVYSRVKKTTFAVPDDFVNVNKIQVGAVVELTKVDSYGGYIQLEKSSSATPYSPYHKTTYQIPDAITQLDGYGWGITDDVCNYVDWENRTYHKKVGIRDFVEGDSDDSTVLTNGTNTLYELTEEVVTDISDIIGDTFQNPFEVEAGGTLTFKNSNSEDCRIPVPNEEEYIIALAEVTA